MDTRFKEIRDPETDRLKGVTMATNSMELRNANGNLAAVCYWEPKRLVIEILRNGCAYRIILPPNTPMEFEPGDRTRK